MNAPADANVMPWTLAGSDGQKIHGQAHLPRGQAVGVMILCHGFKGYKDYGFFPYLARSAANQGLIAHRFNFSHSGMTGRIETFERPDLFEQDTWGRQIYDLQAVAAAATAGVIPGAEHQVAGRLPMTWFGHSRGAVTVALTAARLFETIARSGRTGQLPRLGALVLASPPASACNLDAQQRARLHRQGYLDTPSSRTGQVLRLGRAWLEEIEADPERFDPLGALRQVQCPVLVIHGQDDPTVPVADARRYADAAPDRVVLDLIDGAQHTFNCPNPLDRDESAPAATRRMANAAVHFALAAARA